MQYVLASASPRRKQLLSKILTNFSVIPAEGDEVINYSLSPEKVACSLAERKCEEVFLKNPLKTVIGCDTVVVFKNIILGKPKDQADAEKTLALLSGKTHKVITGVCVKNQKFKSVEYDVTEVTFNILSPQFIKEYVNGGSPLDKAGSYGIQDKGVVKEYAGSYSNVVGLPLELLKTMLLRAEEK